MVETSSRGISDPLRYPKRYIYDVHPLTTAFCRQISSAGNPRRKFSCHGFVLYTTCFGRLLEHGLNFGVRRVVSGPSTGSGTQVWERTADAGTCAFIIGLNARLPGFRDSARLENLPEAKAAVGKRPWFSCHS